MSKNIPKSLRKSVAERAGYRCEYCRRPEADSFIRFQADHIISRKHGGKTTLENLACTCPVCNNNKGTDLVATILENEEVPVRLFNPRKQDWFEHFELVEGEILPKTQTGAATIKILKFNEVSRILERMDLIKAGL
jgi:HNH endonuclease